MDTSTNNSNNGSANFAINMEELREKFIAEGRAQMRDEAWLVIEEDEKWFAIGGVAYIAFWGWLFGRISGFKAGKEMFKMGRLDAAKYALTGKAPWHKFLGFGPNED